MSAKEIFDLASQFVGSGMFTYCATQIVKLAPMFPWVEEGDTARIRAIAVGFSTASIVIMSIVDGKLNIENLQNLATALIGIGVSFFVAHGVHKTIVTSEEGSK